MTNGDIIDLENNNVKSNSTPSMVVDVETSSAPTNTNESKYDENLKKKRKLTFSAWEHFKKIKFGGVMKAICDHCHKHLGAESKNGTRHLLDHIAVCPMIKQKDTRQMLLKANSSSDAKCASLDTYHFNPEVSRYELGRMIGLQLGRMIGLHEYPLSIVEHEGFRRYSNSLQPLFKVYVVPSSHDAKNLRDALMECLLDWNIERKLPTLTLDNCSTNDAMVNVMLVKLEKSLLSLNDKLLHMRCAAHILNLIVKEGLENLFGSGVERIKESIDVWTATPKCLEQFEESVL